MALKNLKFDLHAGDVDTLHVGGLSHTDIDSKEAQEDAVDEEVQIVHVTPVATPLVGEQRRHEGMRQQVLLVMLHLG